MPEAVCTFITPVPCPPPVGTLPGEARVVQGWLAGVGDSVIAGDADALGVEALAEAREAAFRHPPSSRPTGAAPVPSPEPWLASKPTPPFEPLKPSRRGLLASAAGLLALGAVQPTVAATPAAHPDAELIALCAAHDDLERQARATFDSASPAYVEDDDARDSVNSPIREAQKPLVERICALRATTPEGMRARVHSILLWDADLDPAEDALCRGHFTDRRMTAAVFRDLLGECV